MMLLRLFDARSGRERELLEYLRDVAVRMIQRRILGAVQICQYAGTADRILWIQDRLDSSGSEHFLAAEVAATWAQGLLDGLVSHSFAIVDGFYRYPLPRCRVWILEVSPAIGQEEPSLASFLDLSRAVSAEPSVGGMSIYRTPGPPCRLLVFLALNEGVSPSGPFAKPAAASRWRPLVVVSTMGRLSSDPDPRLRTPAGLHPRATFWARSMPVVAVGLQEEGE